MDEVEKLRKYAAEAAEMAKLELSKRSNVALLHALLAILPRRGANAEAEQWFRLVLNEICDREDRGSFTEYDWNR
jgi:hypothetical protein